MRHKRAIRSAFESKSADRQHAYGHRHGATTYSSLIVSDQMLTLIRAASRFAIVLPGHISKECSANRTQEIAGMAIAVREASSF